MSRSKGKSGKDLKAAPPTDPDDAETPKRLLEQSEALEPFDEAVRHRFGELISTAARKSAKRRKSRSN